MAVYGAYQADGSIIRAADGACVPPDTSNKDYQAAKNAVLNGDTITPYVVPVIDLDALDLATINVALAQPGSIVRALGLVVFMIAKGTIPINPSYTQAQFVNLLKAQIR